MNQALAILESLLTPELVGAVALTLAATHMAKILAEAWLEAVTSSARRWRAFSALASIGIGALAGTVAWIGTDAAWYIIPATAFGSGPAWRLAQVGVPDRFTRAFLTSTDRRFRRKGE